VTGLPYQSLTGLSTSPSRHLRVYEWLPSMRALQQSGFYLLPRSRVNIWASTPFLSGVGDVKMSHVKLYPSLSYEGRWKNTNQTVSGFLLELKYGLVAHVLKEDQKCGKSTCETAAASLL
jgi:hypothetical protein